MAKKWGYIQRLGMLTAAFLAVLVFPSIADQPDPLQSGEMVAKVDIYSTAVIEYLSSNSRISKVTIEQTFFPRNSISQKVLSINTEPASLLTEDHIKYSWENPSTRALEFSMSSRVRTTYSFVAIQEKIPFPYLTLEEEYLDYIEPRGNIDSDDGEVAKKANEIAAGMDDYYEVVHSAASWVESNIEYSLDTLTAESSQKASWVLQSREGVCDELTSLFIAMLRSLGIPARYISGIAYTNYNSLNDFGPHAWAEVYFPGYGWVPYDITYGQFGYVDAGHIKLKETFDSNDSTVNYKWDGYQVDLTTYRLNMDAEVESLSGSIPGMIDIELSILKPDVGIGSYNLVIAKLKNPNNFYTAAQLSLSRSSGLEIQGELARHIMLKPKEEKSIFWAAKVDSSLDPNYIYTFKLILEEKQGSKSEASFTARKNRQKYSEDYILSLLAQLQDTGSKNYARDLSISCKAEKDAYYIGENALVRCSLANSGNTALDDISVCIKEDCKTMSMGIATKAEADFLLSYSEPGFKLETIRAGNQFVSKTTNAEFEVLDLPALSIKGVKLPEQIEYGRKYTIEFMLSKDSIADAADVEAVLHGTIGTQTWQLDNLTQDRVFYVSFDSSELYPGENAFFVNISYKDGLGRQYSEEYGFSLEIQNPGFFASLRLWLNSAAGNIGKSASPQMILIAALAAVAVVVLIFWKWKGTQEYVKEIEAEGLSKKEAMQEEKLEEKAELEEKALEKGIESGINQAQPAENKQKKSQPAGSPGKGLHKQGKQRKKPQGPQNQK